MDDILEEKGVTTKTLYGFDHSTVIHRVNLVNSTSMGAIVSEIQENVSGVEEQERVSDNSAGAGAGAEGGLKFAEEFSTANNGEIEKGMGEEGVEFENGGEIERGSEGIVNGDRKGEYFGSTDSSEKLSSIARRTRNRAKFEGFKEDDGGVGQKGSENGDEVDEENPFSVGDFVWGKIKNHPWWPGRIYDPLDASEFALRYKREGRFLVAYFGNGTFAWCDPSQLKKLEENYEEMSKQSSKKTFLSAVEEAENEFCRLLKLEMTSLCAKGNEYWSFMPFVVNGGIKKGVRVPEIGNSVPSGAWFESSKMLADIKRLALFDLVCNSLELMVLKARLSAFYDAKYGYSSRTSTINPEPMGIDDPTDDGGVPKEGSLGGSNDGEPILGPQTPFDMTEEGKKSKTITELLGRDIVLKSRRKRKVSDEEKSYDGPSKVDDQSEKRVERSRRRNRKMYDVNLRLVADNVRATRSSAQKKGGPASDKEVSEEKDGGGETRTRKKMNTVPRVRKKGICVSVNGDPRTEEGYARISPRIEEGYERISPRERKLSKYLSPPYTNIVLQRQRSSSSLLSSDQAEGLVSNDKNLVGSSLLVKCSAQTFQKSSKSPRKTEHFDHKVSQPNLSCDVDDCLKTIGSLNDVLHEIRSAARTPLDSKRAQSFDSVKGFVSSYRSSKFKNGPNYKSFKTKSRNLYGTKHESNSNPNVRNEVDQKTPKSKPLKRSATKRNELNSEPKIDHEASCGPSSRRKKVDVPNKKRPVERENEPLAVVSIKQKLEAMTAMLGQSDGKMTQEIKSKMENESKELLKMVKMMNATSS